MTSMYHNLSLLLNRKNLNLIKEVTIADFKLRDQGSFLGFFWTLLHPALMFTVLYLIFSKWTGTKIENFASFLLVGIVQWNLFATATENALRSIIVKRELVKEMNFPKEVLVISSVLTVLLSYIGEMVILFILLFLILANKFSPTVFLLPAVVLVQIFLVLGVSFVISTLFVFWRDIDRIWSILLKIGFFATPIFYPLSIIASDKQIWLFLNPMTQLINAARGAIIYGRIDFGGFLLTGLASFGLLILGYLIFKTFEHKFAEVL